MENRYCEVCKEYSRSEPLPIPRRMHCATRGNLECHSSWLKRSWCDDECKEVHAYFKRMKLLEERVIREELKIKNQAIVDNWILRAREELA